MSATETLRVNLMDIDVDYGQLGDYATRVSANGLSWLVQDNLNGTLDATTCISNKTPDEVMRVILGHGTAHVLTNTDDDGVGHSECSECGRTVGEWYKFCPWCGARFTEIERSYRP